jgi:hypothetical protein
VAVTAGTDGATLLTIPAAELTRAEASDIPGGGGPFMATAGFSLLSNLMQEEASAWMNNRTVGNRDRTLVRIQGTACEVFLTSKWYSPQDAQLALSGIRALAQGGQGHAGGMLTGLTAPVTPAR